MSLFSMDLLKNKFTISFFLIFLDRSFHVSFGWKSFQKYGSYRSPAQSRCSSQSRVSALFGRLNLFADFFVVFLQFYFDPYDIFNLKWWLLYESLDPNLHFPSLSFWYRFMIWSVVLMANMYSRLAVKILLSWCGKPTLSIFYWRVIKFPSILFIQMLQK